MGGRRGEWGDHFGICAFRKGLSGYGGGRACGGHSITGNPAPPCLSLLSAVCPGWIRESPFLIRDKIGLSLP